MKVTFDLTADDYVAMNLGVGASTSQLIRAFFPRAFAITAFLALLLGPAFNGNTSLAIRSAFTLGALYLAIDMLTWRPRLRRHIRNLYSCPPHSRILGRHTLELSEAGLVSTGPRHTAFRTWDTVTGLIQTDTHLLLPTLFGNVYLLPLTAVADRVGTITFIQQRLSMAQGTTTETDKPIS